MEKRKRQYFCVTDPTGTNGDPANYLSMDAAIKFAEEHLVETGQESLEVWMRVATVKRSNNYTVVKD